MSEAPESASVSRTIPVVIDTEVISCPLCKSTDYDVVVETKDPQWGIPGTFQVVSCRSCSHRYMNPAPTADSLPHCYPANYGPHQNRPLANRAGASADGRQTVAGSVPCDSAVSGRVDAAASATEVAEAGARRPWLLKIIPLRKIPGLRRFYYWLMDDRSQVVPQWPCQDVATGEGQRPRAFELGCAAGAYLEKLQAAGWIAEGLEPGSAAAKTARDAGYDVEQGTLDNRSYRLDSYQWIAMWMVLEHVPDPRRTLSTLFGMLAPGGTLALSVPNAGCWEPVVFGRHWDAWDLPRHLHHFRPATLQRLLEECGYTQIDIQYQRTLLNVIGSLGVWWTSMFPKSRIGGWLRQYPHQPRLWLQLATAPLAQLLAFVGQGGRLTVTAQKPAGEPTAESQLSMPASQKATDS